MESFINWTTLKVVTIVYQNISSEWTWYLQYFNTEYINCGNIKTCNYHDIAIKIKKLLLLQQRWISQTQYRNKEAGHTKYTFCDSTYINYGYYIKNLINVI